MVTKDDVFLNTTTYPPSAIPQPENMFDSAQPVVAAVQFVANVRVAPCCTPFPLNTFALKVFVADIKRFTKFPPTKPMFFDTCIALASRVVDGVVTVF
jgi:hypothetical protein